MWRPRTQADLGPLLRPEKKGLVTDRQNKCPKLIAGPQRHVPSAKLPSFLGQHQFYAKVLFAYAGDLEVAMVGLAAKTAVLIGGLGTNPRAPNSATCCFAVIFSSAECEACICHLVAV